MKMMKPDSDLTDRAYWERVHRASRPKADSWRRTFRLWLNRGYDSHEHLVRTHILSKYLPRAGRAIELGCAPGRNLLAFCARFGLEPFGVEYSEPGYQATLHEFQRQGVDSQGIIHGDFSEPVFRRRHRESYDVVFSRGLIEHFTDPETVVDYHVELLKPGGQLVISIPNLRAAAYYPVTSLLAPDVLAAHNLDIMRLPAFRSLFTTQPLRTHYCDYLGSFKLSFMFGSGSYLISRLQAGIDALMINTVGHRQLRNRHISPHLLYVGTKLGVSQ